MLLIGGHRALTLVRLERSPKDVQEISGLLSGEPQERLLRNSKVTDHRHASTERGQQRQCPLRTAVTQIE